MLEETKDTLLWISTLLSPGWFDCRDVALLFCRDTAPSIGGVLGGGVPWFVVRFWGGCGVGGWGGFFGVAASLSF